MSGSHDPDPTGAPVSTNGRPEAMVGPGRDLPPRSAIRHRAVHLPVKRSVFTRLIGAPLPSEAAAHQTIGKAIGLAVFSSDALSSTAYATQEILVILAAAGTAACTLAFPISIAICILLWIVTLSYEQTIHAYPGGGGAYIVARDNLGEGAAKAAGAALLTDYVLTVSVSVSSGVAQIVSARPDMYEHRVALAVAFVLLICLVNLRGVKESGAVFAVPTYYFIGMMTLTLMVAMYKIVTVPGLALVDPPVLVTHASGLVAITPFLILHAFSSGTAALTGVEAISNGITAFKEPRSRNAGLTLLWMAAILGSMFLSVSFFASRLHLVPSEYETVISQLARTAFGGRNMLYNLTIAATTVILVMGANTAFADFPRLAALMADDGFLPRQLAFRGSRLVFSRGIAALALIACALIAVFHASVTNLIPLYAIGVFLSFTLSQAGMAHRWLKCGRLTPGVEIQEPGSIVRFESTWRSKMVVNGLGAVCTCLVMGVFATTKFRDGAWFVLLLIPTLVLLFDRIHRHYRALARSLSLERYGARAFVTRHRVIVPVSSVHQGTLDALHYARTLSPDVTAVHVATDPEQGERLKRKWELWGGGVRLVILDSPYRMLLEPVLCYIREIVAQRQANEIVTIVVPQFVPSQWWHNALHTQAAFWLRMALLRTPGVVVTDVPYLVRDEQRVAGEEGLR